MKKTDLAGMTVGELKILAGKKGISLKAGAKKADILKALGAGAAAVKKAAKGIPAATNAKAAAKRKPAASAPKTSATGKAVARKAAARKTKAAPAVKPAGKKAADAAMVVAAPSAGPATRTPAREWRIAPAEEQLRVQERVEDAKYYTGTTTGKGFLPGSLPREYGEDRITILSRDPSTLFGYWEVSAARLDAERSSAGKAASLCIRIYDITGIDFNGRNATSTFDQIVSGRIGSWYFNLARPSHRFCADIGLLSRDGGFRTMVRSNIVSMPRDGVSDVVEQDGDPGDDRFFRLYGLPAGTQGGLSSAQARELFARQQLHGVSSHGLFSPQMRRMKVK